MNAPVPVSLVGAGWIAEAVYRRLLAESPRLRLTRVHDPVRDRAFRVAGGDATAVPFEECLGPGVEGVIVCSPPREHAGALRAALRAGKRVLCEKPVLRTCDELAELRAAAPLEGLMGSASMRFRPDVRQLLDWVHAGRVGAIRRLRLGWWRQHGVPVPGSWRTRAAESPSGVLEDLGPHLLDIAVELLGGPCGSGADLSDVTATLECRGGDRAGSEARWFGAASGTYDAPDVCAAEYRTRAGVTVELRVSWVDTEPGDLVEIVVEGERGTAHIEGLLGLSTHRRRPGQRCALRGAERDEVAEFQAGPVVQHAAFAAVLDRFGRFCAGRDAPMASASEIAAVTEWLDAARRSALGGEG